MSEEYEDRLIVVICGGRDFDDRLAMQTQIDALRYDADRLGQRLTVVHGAARGADRIAGEVARVAGIEVIEVPADWDANGRSAGFRRNTEMASRLKASQKLGATVAVVHFPGGRGTEHMVATAKRFELPTRRPVAVDPTDRFEDNFEAEQDQLFAAAFDY